MQLNGFHYIVFTEPDDAALSQRFDLSLGFVKGNAELACECPKLFLQDLNGNDRTTSCLILLEQTDCDLLFLGMIVIVCINQNVRIKES